MKTFRFVACLLGLVLLLLSACQRQHKVYANIEQPGDSIEYKEPIDPNHSPSKNN